jgi:hypothetical protein
MTEAAWGMSITFRCPPFVDAMTYVVGGPHIGRSICSLAPSGSG